MTVRRSFLAILVVALVFASGCANNPIGPGPEPTPTPGGNGGAVLAPPPAGVSSEVWRVGFYTDLRLYRPQAVRVEMPEGVDTAAVAVVLEAAAQAQKETDNKTPFYVGAGSEPAAVFTVVINPNLVCAGDAAATACTTFETDNSGAVVRGKIEFRFMASMRNKAGVLHELLRALGMPENNSKPGIMNKNPWSSFYASDEERAMIQGRYKFPLLAVYAEK